MQVALFEQVLFYTGGYAFAKQKAIGQYQSATSAIFQKVNDQRHKQVGCFAGTVLCRKIIFYTIFFYTTKRGIGNNDIYPVFVAPFGPATVEQVVVLYNRYFYAMQNKIGSGKHVGQRFLFDTCYAVLQLLALLQSFYLLVGFDIVNNIGKETAGSACRVKHYFA